jgi:hypothetical protein
MHCPRCERENPADAALTDLAHAVEQFREGIDTPAG